MGQIDVTDAWLYKYMSMVDEAIINEIEKNVYYERRSISHSIF